MRRKSLSVIATTMAVSMLVCATPAHVKAAEQNTKTETVESLKTKMQLTSVQTKRDTVANILIKDFKKKAKPNKKGKQKSAKALADAMSKNETIPFECIVNPVEEGLLTGLGNAEIKGFKKGYKVDSIFGTTPFVGYVFEVKNKDAGKALIKRLKKNGDLHWNICTHADEMKAALVGKRVIFIMSEKYFEE